jgi:REP element-mobilizing transposase RayT
MQLNAWGEIVEESWKWLADQYAFVSLDDYVIMPNHLHGVIALHPGGRGGSRTAPTQMGKLHPGRGDGSRTARAQRGKPLGRLIGAFKTVSTKRINQLQGTPGKVLWQRGFYDHIIRDDEDLSRIRRYIRLNPMQWSLDRYHP